MADEDSAVADAAPEATSLDSTPQFGDGLFEDTSASADASTEGHSEDAAPTQDGSAKALPAIEIDLLRTPVDQLPDEYKPLAPLAKNFQASYTRTMQDLADQRRTLEQERTQYLEAINRLQAAPAQQSAAADPVEQLRAHLQPEEQRGLEVVNQLLGHSLNPVQEQLQLLQSSLEQLQQAQQREQQTQRQRVESEARAEVSAAREAFGSETVDQYAQQAVALTGTQNPATGQRYTFSEAVALLTGQTLEAAQAARQQAQQVRRSAQAATRPAGAGNTGQVGSNGTDALSKLKALGFE